MKTNTTRAKYNNGKETNRFNNTNLQESNIKTSNNIVKKSFSSKTMNFFRELSIKTVKRCLEKATTYIRKILMRINQSQISKDNLTTFIIINRYKKVIKSLEQMGPKF